MTRPSARQTEQFERLRSELTADVFGALLAEYGGVESFEALAETNAQALLEAAASLTDRPPPATERQLQFLGKLKRRAKLKAAEFRDLLGTVGATAPASLSKTEASALIDELLRRTKRG